MTTNLSLGDIENRTKNYRSARDLLGDRLRQLEDEIEAAKRKAMPLIRSSLNAAKAAEAELSAAIQGNPQHFKRPRTLIFHGVKVGIEKGKGSIKVADNDRTVALIRKHLPEQADVLVKVTESPVKSAIAGLPVADLRRIGAELIESGDQVVIRPVDSELDKALNALLKADEVAMDSDLQQAA